MEIIQLKTNEGIKTRVELNPEECLNLFKQTLTGPHTKEEAENIVKDVLKNPSTKNSVDTFITNSLLLAEEYAGEKERLTIYRMIKRLRKKYGCST